MELKRKRNLFWKLKFGLSDIIILPYRMFKHNNSIPSVEHSKLTSHELHEIKMFWGKEYSNGKKKCYEFYKGFSGMFDARLIPNDYYFLVECIMNPNWSSVYMQHKCCLKYYISKENRPATILQNINGHLLDKEDNLISITDAISLLKNESSFFYKNALITGGGSDIYKIYPEDIKEDGFYYNLLSGKDFIIQKPILQCDNLAVFNPDSVNTIRILSLNINDKCSVLSGFLRMGGKGSFVDNLASGTGALVGINPEGFLFPWGIDKAYHKVSESPSGIKFKNIHIPEYQQVCDFVLTNHHKFQSAELIGWDLSVDKNGNVIVVEINLNSADIAAHQVFNGPIFGDRTTEVMGYVEKNRSNFRLSL